MKTISLVILLLIANITFVQGYELFSIPHEFEDIDPTTGGSGTDYTQVRVADGMLTFDLVSNFNIYIYAKLSIFDDDINSPTAMYWNDLTNFGNVSYDCHRDKFYSYPN